MLSDQDDSLPADDCLDARRLVPGHREFIRAVNALAAMAASASGRVDVTRGWAVEAGAALSRVTGMDVVVLLRAAWREVGPRLADLLTPVTGQPRVSELAAGSGLGRWLRGQREAQGWAKREMARRLIAAGRAAGDSAVPGVESMCHNIRRWENGQGNVTERYRLHYCAALGLEPGQFGRARPWPDRTPRRKWPG